MGRFRDGYLYIYLREGQVYEAYEVKNKRQKLRCLLLRRKKKNIFYLFMKSLHGNFFQNAPVYTTPLVCCRKTCNNKAKRRVSLGHLLRECERRGTRCERRGLGMKVHKRRRSSTSVKPTPSAAVEAFARRRGDTHDAGGGAASVPPWGTHGSGGV